MTKLIALVATTLILSGFVNSANAAALASASANITSLIWYIDSDGSGDHTDADQVLTSNVLSGGADTIIRGGSDVIFGDVRLSVGDNENVNMFRDAGQLTDDLQAGPICVGVGCGSPPTPTGDQFVSAELALGGFYTAVGGVQTGIRSDFRSEVSLSEPDADTAISGESNAAWSDLFTFRANAQFDTYFEVAFQAQAIADLSADVGSGSANAGALLELNLNNSTTWTIFDLNARASTPGQVPIDIEQSETLYSYNSIGMFRLTTSPSYTVSIEGRTTATATAAVPAPPAIWLVAVGLFGLAVGRFDWTAFAKRRIAGRSFDAPRGSRV